MFGMLILALAAVAQDRGPLFVNHDPPPGPRPAENHTLSQPHRNMDARMFPDLAVKDLRIDGDTLYVLVANQGGARSGGPIRVAAQAEVNGARIVAGPARIGRLKGGETRWVPLNRFSVAAASIAGAVPMLFALDDASVVLAEVSVPAESASLDRTGQGCDCVDEVDLSNNGVRADGKAITRGRP